MFILVKNGITQTSQQNGETVLLIFADYDEAKRVAKIHGVTVANVGSIQDETLVGHLEVAEQSGYRAALVQNGVMRFFEK